jgi:hypothetical protein
VTDVIKIGPPWGTVVNPLTRVVKYRFRTVCKLDDLKQLRLREYISRDEEEQLLDHNPPVQKTHRDAELYGETKDGRTVLIGALDQAGLLLDQAMLIAQAAGRIPVQTERVHLAPGQG